MKNHRYPIQSRCLRVEFSKQEVFKVEITGGQSVDGGVAQQLATPLAPDRHSMHRSVAAKFHPGEPPAAAPAVVSAAQKGS